MTMQKLETIHVLVNSNMTAAIQSELDALIAQLALMKEVIHLKGSASKEATDAMEGLEAKIAELKSTLYDRQQ